MFKLDKKYAERIIAGVNAIDILEGKLDYYFFGEREYKYDNPIL